MKNSREIRNHSELADHGRLARSDACGMLKSPSVGITEQSPLAKVLRSSCGWIFWGFLEVGKAPESFECEGVGNSGHC